jgi:hypothetical protein
MPEGETAARQHEGLSRTLVRWFNYSIGVEISVK